MQLLLLSAAFPLLSPSLILSQARSVLCPDKCLACLTARMRRVGEVGWLGVGSCGILFLEGILLLGHVCVWGKGLSSIK